MLEMLPDQLKKKIAIDERTGCWMWTAATDKRGYGRVNYQSKPQFSHRVVYAILKGDMGGLPLDHLCRVTGCCNPDHLEAVSNAENVRRGAASATTKLLYSNHLFCPQGHPLFGENLYAYVMKTGNINKQCRTCRSEKGARYYAERLARERKAFA